MKEAILNFGWIERDQARVKEKKVLKQGRVEYNGQKITSNHLQSQAKGSILH